MSYGEVPVKYIFDRNSTTLINAKNGSGKCVDKSTTINVKFKNDETKDKFIKFISKQSD